MLAVLEHQVTALGGTYAYVDTDAMAIVASPDGGWLECPTPDGSGRVRVLSFTEVTTILGHFEAMNPFDRRLVPSLWKVEHDSMTRPLRCYALSAKRYALFRDGGGDLVALAEDADEAEEPDDTEERLEDWSEHSLGLYRSPLVDEQGKPLRDSDGRLVWIREAWQWLLERARGGNPAMPGWSDTFALTQFSVSSPIVGGWFAGRDAAVDRSERMRPGSFGLLGHPHLANGPMPAAPFESNPRRWPHLDWFNRTDGKTIRVVGLNDSLDSERRAHLLSSGYVPIRTLGGILRVYEKRPEHKSLAPDGTRATGETRGLLRRRPVSSGPAITKLSGKEGNKLIERASGVTGDPKDYRSDFGMRLEAWDVARPVLQRMGNAEVARRSGVPLRTVQRALGPVGTMMSRTTRERLIEATCLGAEDVPNARHTTRLSVTTKYRGAPLPSARQCVCGCGRRLALRQRKWFSDACRLRAHRRSSLRAAHPAGTPTRRFAPLVRPKARPKC